MRTMKKTISVLLALCMIFALSTVAFAENGPCTGEESIAYIALVEAASIESEEYDFKFIWAENAYEEFDEVNGLTYDRATNTLTLENINLPGYALMACDMGNDFTINVVGENSLIGIGALGLAWTAGLKITGNGKLILNEDCTFEDAALSVYAGFSDGNLVIDSDVTLNIGVTLDSDYPGIIVSETTRNKDAVVIKGNVNEDLFASTDEYEFEDEPGVLYYDHYIGSGVDNIIITPFIVGDTGDVNGDGKISVIDAKWVLQSVTGLRELTAEQTAAADVSADGRISVLDAKLILKAVVA